MSCNRRSTSTFALIPTFVNNYGAAQPRVVCTSSQERSKFQFWMASKAFKKNSTYQYLFYVQVYLGNYKEIKKNDAICYLPTQYLRRAEKWCLFVRRAENVSTFLKCRWFCPALENFLWAPMAEVTVFLFFELPNNDLPDCTQWL